MKKLFSAVLVLAMLCPVFACFATVGASAALEVSDGLPALTTNSLNEEWNFDDMTEGETLSGGYINSHARGEVTFASQSIDGLSAPEKWTAVADEENGGYYIYADNAYMAFEDHNKILLSNTYEVSWRMRVDAIGSNTTLLWWTESEKLETRNCLLRYNTNGSLGYTTDNTYQSTVGVGAQATNGRWHDYRARISPTDGRMWLWLDGELVLDGAVNEYLKNNAKDAEASMIGIFYAWGGSGMKVALDDIKITGVTLDEHLTFENPEAPTAISATWDFEDGKPTSQNGITVNSGSNYNVVSTEGDSVNASKVMHVSQRETSGSAEGPTFTLPGKINDYDTITISFKVRHNYSSNLVNMMRLQNKDGSYSGSNLFRVTSMKDNKDAAAYANFLSDSGTNAGKFLYEEWETVTVVINPTANKITARITNSEGTSEKSLNGNSTMKTLFDGLIENDKPFKFMLYAHYGAFVDIMFDDISITATPLATYGKDLLDFEEFTAGTTLDADKISDGADTGLYYFKTERSGDILSKVDPKDESNKTLYLGDRIMYFEFKQKLSIYEKLYVSYDVYFEQMGGYTSFMSVNDTNGDGKYDNFLRLNNSNGKIGYSTTGSDESLIATLTQGTNAKWYSFGFEITPSTGNVVWTVKERDTGAIVVDRTFNSTPIKLVYDRGESLVIRLNYTWGASFKAYFDNIFVDAPIFVENTVNEEFKDPTFKLVDSEVTDMDNEDWEIVTTPKNTPPAGVWSFDDGKVDAQNGITASISSGMEFATVDGKAVLSTDPSKGDRYASFALPGSIRDYDTINIAFKIKYDNSNNVTNVIRFRDSTGDSKSYKTLFRIPKLATEGASGNVTYRTVGTTGTESSAKITQGEWADFNVTIVPSTGEVKAIINGTAVNFISQEIKALYDANMAFNFQHYYQVGMIAGVHFDDLSVTTDYYQNPNNTVLKTRPDNDGNVRGILAIKDSEKYLTTQPFEISFDYMMNQKPSGWLNLVKIKMNNNAISIFRLDPNGIVYNYTSAAYKTVYGISGSSGHNNPLNVVSTKLIKNRWYNIRAVIDPTSGHIMGYVNNLLVCDYNINDVYIDENKTPMGVMDNPTQMLIELSSQHSASDIPINDSCIDNVRIRTLGRNEYTKTTLSDTDFDGIGNGALTAAEFGNETGLYTKSLAGSFNVAGSDVAKYIDATVKGGEGIAIDMTNGYAPLATETLAFEGNFTFTELASGEMLDIYSLKRNENEAVPLLSIDGEGRLFVGGADAGRKITAGAPHNIKLIFGGASGTAELYVDTEFVTALSVIADLPKIICKDSMGNETGIYNKKFLVSESATEKALSGVMLQKGETTDPFFAKYPEDTLYFLAPAGEGSWNVKFDDLKVTVDAMANLYSEKTAEGYAFADVNGKLWGNDFVARFTYNSTSDEIVSVLDWTVGSQAVSLVKAGGGKLYSADGATELKALGENDDIAVFVSTEYWESQVGADNHPVRVTVYLGGEMVGSYIAHNSDVASSGALSFAEGVSDARVYLGNTLRDNRAPAAAGGAKFEGYTAFSVDFEDEKFFDLAEENSINYVEWAFSDLGKKVTDMEGATVILSEHVKGEDNSFFRIRRPELSGKPSAYMEYNLAAMGEYAALYSVELDMRYTDGISSSIGVATLYSKNMAGEVNLLSVDYLGRFYFISNGIRYYLCDNAGEALLCNKPSDESFSRVGLVVNEAEGSYSIWIDGKNAYYYKDGQTSGTPVAATEVAICYDELESYSVCAPKIRLFEGSDNGGSDSVADIDNISIDVIKNGMSPVNVATQVIKDGGAIRFIATVDTLYTNYVGFEIISSSNLVDEKNYEDKSGVVFSSIVADGKTITAEELGGRYVVTFSVIDLPTAEYTFKVRPFAEIFGERFYGEEAVYEYDCTALIPVQ